MVRLLVLLAMFSPVCLSAGISGPVRVVDGDTLWIGTTKVRLAGIDAPELRQTCIAGAAREVWCGQTARAVLQRDFGGQTAQCTPRGRSYDRTVAQCWVNGQDIGAAMVARGWALAVYGDQYRWLETAAKANGRGIHGLRHMPPELFRRHRVSGVTPPDPDCAIKGNRSRNGWIYHLPGQRFYDQTVVSLSKGEAWFCSPAQARDAGYRPAKV